jgi:hypothetical protein
LRARSGRLDLGFQLTRGDVHERGHAPVEGGPDPAQRALDDPPVVGEHDQYLAVGSPDQVPAPVGDVLPARDRPEAVVVSLTGDLEFLEAVADRLEVAVELALEGPDRRLDRNAAVLPGIRLPDVDQPPVLESLE